MPIKVSMVINTAPLPVFRSRISILLRTIVPPSPFSPKAHGEPCVFNRHEDYEGPYYKRKNTHDVIGGRFEEEKNNGEGINGACTNISEDKTKGFSYSRLIADNMLPAARPCLRVSLSIVDLSLSLAVARWLGV